MVLSGGSEPIKITQLDSDLDTLLRDVEIGLLSLIKAFDDSEAPYYCLPYAPYAPRFNDYEHLGRVQEWAVSDFESEPSV